MIYGTKLLRAIIDVVNDLGPDSVYHPKRITDELLSRKYWGNKVPKTPLRTVTSYFSLNPEIFTRPYGRGRGYLMAQSYHRPVPRPKE
jgi:hypothetical protein